MEGTKLVNDKYFGGDALFRSLFEKYGSDIYKMLLEKYADPQLAREMLKSIFQDAYRIILEVGTIDITALWLRALAEAVSSKRQLPPPQTRPPQTRPPQVSPPQAQPFVTMPQVVGQTAVYQAQSAPSAVAQMPIMQAQATPQTAVQAPFIQAQPVPPPAAQAKPGLVRPMQPSYEPYIPAGKMKEKDKPRNTGRILVMAGLSAMILLTVWMLIGLLMDVQVIPDMDLGYKWFNANVFNLF